MQSRSNSCLGGDLATEEKQMPAEEKAAAADDDPPAKAARARKPQSKAAAGKSKKKTTVKDVRTTPDGKVVPAEVPRSSAGILVRHEDSESGTTVFSSFHISALSRNMYRSVRSCFFALLHCM